MEQLAEEGLSPVSMAQLQAEARRQVRARLVSGLPRMRLYADQASSVVRANRVEGIYTGLGASFSPHEDLKVEGLAGYASGPGRPSATVKSTWNLRRVSGLAVTFEGYGRRLEDLGPRPGASGAVNTFSTLFWDQDFTDPYFASGLSAGLEYTGQQNRTWARLGWERHTAGRQAWMDAPIRDLTGSQARRPPRDWGPELEIAATAVGEWTKSTAVGAWVDAGYETVR